MAKSIQELAREFSLGYTSKEEQNAAFAAYNEGYRKGKEDKLTRDNCDLSFAIPAFQPILYDWLLYKIEKGQKYKGQRSIIACYKKLVELSDGDATVAKMIVDQSMSCNYAGLFPLKENNGNRTYKNGGQGNDTPSIFDVADNVLQEAELRNFQH